ncbi:MAG: hypothetical protein WD468_03315 [Pirellulales bacterium]
MQHPFDATPDELIGDLSGYVQAVIGSLQSSFMVMPKGGGFVEYGPFEAGYQALKQATRNFENLSSDAIMNAVTQRPMSLVVLRTILGFTAPEWAYMASERAGTEVSAGYARSIDRRIRDNPDQPLNVQASSRPRVEALVATACELIEEGAPEIGEETLHRLDKVDTREGVDSLQQAATLNVAYPMLLYERMLGRPFATHRDAVSEHVADLMELPIEEMLTKAGISHQKTKRAERLPGFDQAPDFCIPDAYNPQIVIEAKITEDDGTARDKITRVQRLGFMKHERQAAGKDPFEVIACIDGRGFTRVSDIEKLITSTDGKVFTLNTLERMIECSRLREFVSRP